VKIPDESIKDVLNAVRSRYNDDLAAYSDCLSNAFNKSEAIFWNPRYLEFYWHCVTTVPNYIQEVIIANADAESHGSEGLFDLWSKVRGIEEFDAGVKSHFLDEARHARLFLYLTNLAFPDYFDDDALSKKKDNLFNPTKFDENTFPTASASLEYIVDNLVQMNIGEIRTRAHMYMIGPVLTALAPKENKEKIDGILTGLVFDEVTHIGYTAKIMNALCKSGHEKLVRDLYEQRVRDFNVFTLQQTRRSVELFGEGKFPELLEV
jgi:hypothetical protein